MGADEPSQPPKKKLKQAQLPFCVLSSDKSRNKRKLNEGSPPGIGQALKLPRQDTAKSPKLIDANKENLKLTLASPSVVARVDLTHDSEESGNDVIRNDDGANAGTNIRSAEAKDPDCDRAFANFEPIITITEDQSDTQLCLDSTLGNRKAVEPAPSSEYRLADPKCTADGAEIEENKSAAEQDIIVKNEPANSLRESSGVGEASTASLAEVDSSASTVPIPNVDSSASTAPIPNVDSSALTAPIANVDSSATAIPKGQAVVEASTSCTESVPQKGESESEKKDEDNSANDVEAKGDTSNDSSTADVNSSVLVTDSDDPSVADSPVNKKLALTPKGIAKQLEKQKRRALKLKLRQEKEEMIRQKKEEKRKKKLEEQQMKENERKQKIEEKKRKEEAKEDEKKRKEEERKKKEEAKEEEKKKKEEERKRKEEMKEEDRRKKEEAKLAEERKENLVKMAFSKFFIPTKPKSSIPESNETGNVAEPIENKKFMPFPLKADMKLAVVVRHSIGEEEKENLTKLLDPSVDHPLDKLYLQSIMSGERKPLKSGATWPVSEEQHDVIVVEAEDETNVSKSEEVHQTGKSRHNRAKLLLFHENRRPPYWGTWRKKSANVTPRRPFGKDNVFDYEVDSDSEWEDEEEGEDIEKEADSDKEQSDDENVGEHGYIIDKTFVPHGYLSDEEAAQGEEDEESDPEDQKVKLNLLKQEFEQDLKSKTQRLKPRLLGLVMVPNDVTEVSHGSLYETIMNFRCVWDEAAGPLDPLAPAPESPTRTPITAASKFTPPIMERLVKLIHGNRSSFQSLVMQFIELLETEKLPRLPKSAIKNKIKEIARKVLDNLAKRVWKVNANLCAEYNLPEITVAEKSPTTVPPSPVAASPKVNHLTNFLKTASPQEPRRRVTPTLISSKVSDFKTDPVKPSAPSTPAHPDPPVRKRIAPITLSKTVSFSFGSSAAPPVTSANAHGPDTLASVLPNHGNTESSA